MSENDEVKLSSKGMAHSVRSSLNIRLKNFKLILIHE